MHKLGFKTPIWMIELGTLVQTNPNEQWRYFCDWLEAYLNNYYVNTNDLIPSRNTVQS